MSQSDDENVVDCPVCESSHIDTSLDSLGGFCEDCGFAVQDATDVTLPDWTPISDDVKTDESEDWLSYCRVRDDTERRLAEAFDTIETVAARLQTPKSQRLRAAELYCDAFVSGVTDCRPSETVVTVCLGAAAIEDEEAIPPGRIVDEAPFNRKQFRNARAAVEAQLDVERGESNPVQYLSFLRRDLDLGQGAVSRTTDLLEEISSHSAFIGKSPAGIVAAAVYIATDTATQRAVSEATGVSTETVRQRHKQFNEVLNLD